MLEIYLFINPLCTKCLELEKYLLKLANNVPYKIYLQFIPITNLKVLQENRFKFTSNWIGILPGINNITYQIILDYKAALFQGKKSGRNLLLNLQTSILNDDKFYDNQLLKDIAQQSHLDLATFYEDRLSYKTQQVIKEDQLIANQLNITTHETAIIINCSSNEDGIIVDNTTPQELEEIFNSLLKDNYPFNQAIDPNNKNEEGNSSIHLI